MGFFLHAFRNKGPSKAAVVKPSAPFAEFLSRLLRVCVVVIVYLYVKLRINSKAFAHTISKRKSESLQCTS